MRIPVKSDHSYRVEADHQSERRGAVVSRTKLAGESPLQRLARELGRTKRAVLSRRQRLTDKRAAAELDRAIVAAVEAGVSLKEARRRAGVSPQMVKRIVDRDAPH